MLGDEQMSNGYPFSLLNDEQMSNKVGVKHQPDSNLLIIVVPSKVNPYHPHAFTPPFCETGKSELRKKIKRPAIQYRVQGRESVKGRCFRICQEVYGC